MNVLIDCDNLLSLGNAFHDIFDEASVGFRPCFLIVLSSIHVSKTLKFCKFSIFRLIRKTIHNMW